MEQPRLGGASIGTVNADGTGARAELVAVGPADRDAAWAPDGRRLAFTSTRDGNEEIYVLDVETGVQIRLTADPATDRDAAWSPDGASIAFASERDGNSEIYVMPAAGGAARRLTVDPALEQQPAWSSRGVIAFASNRAGDLDLYVMDDQGGGVGPLTQEPGLDADPSWAPDGSQLAYTHGGEANLDIYAIGADGQNRRVLTGSSPRAREHLPAWSPDGTRIAFESDRQIQVMPAAGGPALTVASGTDPNWGPLPPPVAGPDLGRTVTITPAGARVLVAPATTQRPSTAPGLEAELRSAVELPVGTTIDASRGTVAIDAVTTTPDGPGTVGHASVSGGVFTVTQGREASAEPTFQLLPGFRSCARARISVVNPDPEYRMRVRARGRFRSVGGYGRAAGRGTDWLMHNRCDGTTFKVYEGVVLVRDFRRRTTVRVPAGRCYLAASRLRRDALKPRRTCPRVRAPR
jgi:Tol biopolymer transport system component